MATPTNTRQILLQAHPTAAVDPATTFKQTTTSLPPTLEPDQLLVQIRYLSNDPAQRGWISYHRHPERLYVPPVLPGEVMRALTICTVVRSTSPTFQAGDPVVAVTGWTEYAVVRAASATPLRAVPGLAETHFLGALGITGMTAFYGLEVVRAGSGVDEMAVVSGAAGATGSMVVQIAKHLLGVKKVVGLAGSEDKCRWVESLGADVCINYKDPGWKRRLREVTEGDVDWYFDNVGPPILDAVMARMKPHGRIAACGAVASYNAGDAAEPVRNWFEVISSRLQISGFIVTDGQHRFGEYTNRLVEAYQAGKIKIDSDNETVVETKFEDVPKTWLKLFEGANQGKLITKLV